MALPTVRILQTIEHRCGYYDDRLARDLVIDPAADDLAGLYDIVVSAGFRRTGSLIFRPHCRTCRACMATRLPVHRLRKNRAQRRCVRANADLELTLLPAAYSGPRFRLYCAYLNARHCGGGMDNPTREEFVNFFDNGWSRTQMMEMRLDSRLLAVAIFDRLSSGLSAVYTFFDPSSADRSLGTYAVIKLVDHARELGLDYVYLGYWLANHPKMDYKTRFRPIEVFDDGRWVAPPRAG